MEVQPQEKTYEKPCYTPVRRNAQTGPALSDEDLFCEWKTQQTAFGLVLVAYAFLMSLAPLIARYPDETSQMVCASLHAIVDWRAWVVMATVLCLVAILVIALKRRHETASGA
ncbi:hypothetical protein LMG19083_04586 [Ralstonia psammae]|uniref:Transmembrane protein n=1 Tax=Ralstonia psammae TaxID=3058598 RepID=A0ABN9JG17_9RALS|nr:hypothetical protein [Ralstonia sp. LMG 19083]CAJ0807599.1 hypothetical protein LMG19083_04586 [Ralstonia sp. LMG 19083]